MFRLSLITIIKWLEGVYKFSGDSRYGNHLDTLEGKKEHDFWLELLKSEARKGNPEAKKHFLDGNPD